MNQINVDIDMKHETRITYNQQAKCLLVAGGFCMVGAYQNAKHIPEYFIFIQRDWGLVLV